MSDHLSRVEAQWARERPDLDTSAVALVGRVIRAARFLEQEVQRELERHGVGVPEFNALSALRRAGPPHELTVTELGESLLFTSGGLAKLVDRLERTGLVARAPDPGDRRRTLVRLTATGREVQERAMDAHLRNEEELLAPLGDPERALLSAGLATLLAAFEAGQGRARPLARTAPR